MAEHKSNRLLVAACVAALVVVAAALAFKLSAGAGETANPKPAGGDQGAAPVAGQPAANPWAAATAGVSLLVKAEDARTLQAKMVQGEDADNRSVLDSAGQRARVKFVWVPDDTYGEDEDATASRAVFEVKVTEAGVYYPWARVCWQDGCGNSIEVLVQREGEQPVQLQRTDGTYKTWQWVPLSGDQPALDLKPGTYIVTIVNREDGARVSRLLFTTRDSKSYRPATPEG